MPSNQEAVGLGLIGVGVIGRRHLRLMASEPACRLVALVDPAPEVVALASDLEVSYCSTHLEMFRVERPEGVVVAGPTPSHAWVGLDCVRHGVPVLMGTPFTDTVGEQLVWDKSVGYRGSSWRLATPNSLRRGRSLALTYQRSPCEPVPTHWQATGQAGVVPAPSLTSISHLQIARREEGVGCHWTGGQGRASLD